MIFTLLNVISHGIPYIALIYVNQRSENHLKVLPKLFKVSGMAVFVILLLFLALSEEFLWEILVWNEQVVVFDNFDDLEQWQILIVPLLMVPQFTHYILDGIIWKRKITK